MRKFILLIYLSAVMCFAVVLHHVNPATFPRLTGDEKVVGEVIPYKGGRQSPGEQIGYTAYDVQANGSFGQRLALDDLNQIHVDWMFTNDEWPGGDRIIQWNFRYADGFWYGEVGATWNASGYCQLDITRDADIDSQRTVIAYHYGNSNSWIQIDKGNGWGAWSQMDAKTPGHEGHMWPYICVASNNNIVMATGHLHEDSLHLYLTTDEGDTWAHLADFDSCTCLSHFVRASHNPGSQKVVYVWTQSIAMEYIGFLISLMANDVWYMLSTDNGVTWGEPVNITNFKAPGQMVHGDSTTWANCDVNAVFDKDDKLHIAFGANLGYMLNDTIYYGERAKIFHWDEVLDTFIVISSPSIYYDEPGGWWLDMLGGGISPHCDAWRLPADRPQLVVDPNGYLFCIWHGQDDTTDYSAAGWFNGEFYGSYSTDNGITWSDYINLTNTRSPGAAAGDCFDEDYMTAYPYVVNDSIYLTYIEDKDAGAIVWTITAWTQNPVRCWVFHKGLILGTEEQETYRPEYTTSLLEVYPNPFNKMTDIRYQIPETVDSRQYTVGSIKIYDAMGRLIKDFSKQLSAIGHQSSVTWYGRDDSGKKLPSGVYFLRFQTDDFTATEKVILLR